MKLRRNAAAFLSLLFPLFALFATDSHGQKSTGLKLEKEFPDVVAESKLYITVNGKKELIESAALSAWLIGGGSEVAYATLGGGGFSGERLNLYSVATKRSRAVLAKNGLAVAGLTEVPLSTGARAILVRLVDSDDVDDEQKASYLAVIDAARGQVLFLENAEANRIAGNRVSISIYREKDWKRINSSRSGSFNRRRSAVVPIAMIRQRKTEIIDLRKVLANEVIIDDGM